MAQRPDQFFDHSGAAIKSEWWPASERNGGRDQLGIGGTARTGMLVAPDSATVISEDDATIRTH